MQIIKRNGLKEEFRLDKIRNAVKNAFKDYPIEDNTIEEIVNGIKYEDNMSVEEIQDLVVQSLRDFGYDDIADKYTIYRYKHKEAALTEEKIKYMQKYASSNENASTLSNTDANANVSDKNVANLEGEVYKDTNRLIQRRRMKKELDKLYPGEDLGHKYIEDLENHIGYQHDEGTTPVLKPYCQADSLYPLMTEGVGNIDHVTPTPPNDIESFSGQMTNLVFLLSSQCKGATAYAGYNIALAYYVEKEFGPEWWNKLDVVYTNSNCLQQHTIRYKILKGIKQFFWGINQPAGNRSYNSPFTNISWFDKYYFKAMYGEFYYPDGTQPKWEAIDCLQRLEMKLLRDIRLITPVTFPVTTISLLYDKDTKRFKDQEYYNLAAEEWAKGGSFFCYMNSNPAALASCCRLANEMDENTFSSTTGMNGEMTGSCNVYTLNLNRIIQNWVKSLGYNKPPKMNDKLWLDLKAYLGMILERVYKYQIAYKTMLYDMEDQGMLAMSKGNYIYMKKLYSTIGVIGYMEAAEYLGYKISNNEEYKNFLSTLLGFIHDMNKTHSIKDKKRPFKFNMEAIPGESLGVKLYNWDKADGYVVTPGRERYSCYFFNPWDKSTSVLDKLELHGGAITKATDGGQACHINLDAHLSIEQYKHLMDFAAKIGCTYFTFNIPMSECKGCHHIVNAPIKECPICHSKNIRYYTRIIGYLRPVDAWSDPMQQEFTQRIYTDKTISEISNGIN